MHGGVCIKGGREKGGVAILLALDTECTPLTINWRVGRLLSRFTSNKDYED